MSVYNSEDQGWYGTFAGMGHHQGEVEGVFDGWWDGPLPASVEHGYGVLETRPAVDGEMDSFPVPLGEGKEVLWDLAYAWDARDQEPRRR